MIVTELNIDELDKLAEIANNFYSSSDYLDNFQMDVFKKNWINFLESGLGIIFTLRKDNEIVGILGALKYPDVNSGELMATELFWFVNEGCRGKGLYLLKAFEKWAKVEGCKKIIMVYLSDSMPEKLKRVYKKFGYSEMETHYIKEVV